MGKLTSLYHDQSLTVTEQSDGSLTIVQESNDVRDSQQVVHISAAQWQQIRGVRALLLEAN